VKQFEKGIYFRTIIKLTTWFNYPTILFYSFYTYSVSLEFVRYILLYFSSYPSLISYWNSTETAKKAAEKKNIFLRWE